MTLLLRLALPLLLSLLPPVAAWAQTTPPAPAAPAAPTAASAKPPSAGESQALQLFKLLDTNGDGRVSRAEAEVAIRLKPSLAELFRRTDTNSDGYLTQDEIRKVADRRRAEREARRARERAAAEGQTSAAKAPAAPTATR